MKIFISFSNMLRIDLLPRLQYCRPLSAKVANLRFEIKFWQRFVQYLRFGRITSKLVQWFGQTSKLRFGRILIFGSPLHSRIYDPVLASCKVREFWNISTIITQPFTRLPHCMHFLISTISRELYYVTCEIFSVPDSTFPIVLMEFHCFERVYRDNSESTTFCNQYKSVTCPGYRRGAKDNQSFQATASFILNRPCTSSGYKIQHCTVV